MEEKLKFPPEPTWDYHPCDSADSRERRKALEEWSNECRKVKEAAADVTRGDVPKPVEVQGTLFDPDPGGLD